MAIWSGITGGTLSIAMKSSIVLLLIGMLCAGGVLFWETLTFATELDFNLPDSLAVYLGVAATALVVAVFFVAQSEGAAWSLVTKRFMPR